MIEERLKFLRERNNLTQKEAAAKINKSPQAYNYYEKGSREPDIETLIKLANLYAVSLDYLVGRNFHPKSSLTNLTTEEIDHLEKYRALDKRGKNMVNTVLDQEYEQSGGKLNKSSGKVTA